MKISDVELDVLAYMALNEAAKNESFPVSVEDLNSKVSIHARKIKDNNSGIVIRI
jgi:hypothetical protein